MRPPASNRCMLLVDSVVSRRRLAASATTAGSLRSAPTGGLGSRESTCRRKCTKRSEWCSVYDLTPRCSTFGSSRVNEEEESAPPDFLALPDFCDLADDDAVEDEEDEVEETAAGSGTCTELAISCSSTTL